MWQHEINEAIQALAQEKRAREQAKAERQIERIKHALTFVFAQPPTLEEHIVWGGEEATGKCVLSAGEEKFILSLDERDRMDDKFVCYLAIDDGFSARVELDTENQPDNLKNLARLIQLTRERNHADIERVAPPPREGAKPREVQFLRYPVDGDALRSRLAANLEALFAQGWEIVFETVTSYVTEFDEVETYFARLERPIISTGTPEVTPPTPPQDDEKTVVVEGNIRHTAESLARESASALVARQAGGETYRELLEADGVEAVHQAILGSVLDNALASVDANIAQLQETHARNMAEIRALSPKTEEAILARGNDPLADLVGEFGADAIVNAVQSNLNAPARNEGEGV